MKPIRTDVSEKEPDGPEHGACAIYLSARKQGQSTFGTLKRSLGALIQMGHRTGFVNGEGDGAGVQTDIPRRLWAKRLSQNGLPSYLATQPGFWVGHLFIPHHVDFLPLRSEVETIFNEKGLNLLLLQPGRVRREALGQSARIDPPSFWQLAGYCEAEDVERRLLEAQTLLEQRFAFHFASLSSYTVVYKVRGSVEALSRYYPDLQDHNFDTSMVLCHARYSTNTVSSFERAQPFAILGHNGEINTIQRLRLEAQQINAPLPPDGSDSQDLDRTLHTLCVNYGLDLIEAMEMVFPPTPFELERFSPDLRAAYARLRQAFGPYAQGPAGVVARFANTIVASVDALGLRPLWFIETEKEYIFCSERGAVPLENMVHDARPLAPGEKMAIHFYRGERPDVFDHSQIREQVMVQAYQREAPQLASYYWAKGTLSTPPAEPLAADEQPVLKRALPWQDPEARALDAAVLAANGWLADHLDEAAALASPDPDALVSSLGYDGPLAILSRQRTNLADAFKESVAVVTNPALDFAREGEAFSTVSMVGACAPIGKAPDPADCLAEVQLPLLLGGQPGPFAAGLDDSELAKRFGTQTIEAFLAAFADRYWVLTLGLEPGETSREALERLARQAVEAVSGGAQCLVLDDSRFLAGECGWLDVHLAVSRLDDALRQAPAPVNLRRRAGLVVRCAAVRSLHDVALLCGLGADAINPYALWQRVTGEASDRTEALARVLTQLQLGLQKVISTMGCHELRGYGRVFSSIGLAPSLAKVLGCPNYFGSEETGFNWSYLDQEAELRRREIRAESRGETRTASGSLPREARFLPRFWKAAAAYARSEVGYGEVRRTYARLSSEMPVALRHLVGIRQITDVISPSDVDLTVHGSSLPFVLEAMSFGSQGATSFRAYLQAAVQLNILCMNGEGGELPDLLGNHRQVRGQQVASGRFGVNAHFLNSAAVIEIKIGQGAKPGEGGMLPASKVTPAVAQARHTPPNVALLSPSNNHDLYSIEDLAQLIEELHMVNPQARISVKVPVVPGIGVIAVGIAKAGADIINLCGYDGGTGAARKHSLQYVGLPVEIGLIQAHRALVDAGIRQRVELWCNGGMKTAEDVVKMVLLGANRVGFATLAMIALGCTVCRRCNLSKCAAGIATQAGSLGEAEVLGIKGFTPLDLTHAVERLVRLFKGTAEEVRALTAQLGATRLQDLVGRADLLEQIQLKERIDLSPMFEPVPLRPRPALQPGVGILLTRPRNSLTSILTEVVLNTVKETEREMTYQDSVMAYDRALGARLAGEMVRQPDLRQKVDTLHLRFGPSAVAGNGFAAWVTDQLDILIEGGAQDGVAKGAAGGLVAVMKGLNHEGMRVDGSVGKSFAYGAQRGILIVQGNADSRACVRLSGAEVVFGGEITAPVDDRKGIVAAQANLKGFACEYMTSGKVVILGDPGPYAFSGMTGGVVYQMLSPAFGFDEAALRRRLARGAKVEFQALEPADLLAAQRLLGHYIDVLEQTYQTEVAEHIRSLCIETVLLSRFIKIVAA